MLTVGKVAQAALAFALPTSIILIYWWYKNRSDEDAYGKKRCVTSRNTVIEVKVPQQAIGAVIGRQGSKIKQIQRETGAVMHFQGKESSESGAGDNSHNSHRFLVIRGTPESAHQAELMVYQVIASVLEILTEEIEVPSYSVGRIIGKGGGTVKEISSISGAKIAIDRNDSLRDENRPRIISLSGSRKQIDTALDLIQIQLEEEEQFQAKVIAANTKHKNDKKNPKEHIKITAVPRNNEMWDVSSDAHSSYQEKLLNVCGDSGDANIQVYVSAVEHPGHFWVQMIGTKALHLEQLQNDITNFACSDDARMNYTVTDVNPGELVAAKFETSDETYYRAKIVGEVDGGKVDLYFVDFGDNAFADKKDIFRLRSDFTSFPFQAIECILANVEPVGGKWSEEAIVSFEDLTYCAKWKSLLAHVVTYKNLKEGQKIPVVQLFDTGVIDVASELVQQGFAVAVDSLGQGTHNSMAGAAVLNTSPSVNSRTKSTEVTMTGDS